MDGCVVAPFMCGCTVYVWLHRLCVVSPFMCGCTVYGKKRPPHRHHMYIASYAIFMIKFCLVHPERKINKDLLCFI